MTALLVCTICLRYCTSRSNDFGYNKRVDISHVTNCSGLTDLTVCIDFDC